MTSCIGAALIIHCVLDPTPRLSPAEAAAILTPHQFVALPPAEGPYVVIIGSSPTTGPFGEFAPFPPARRLDGTLLSERPSIMRVQVSRRPGERFKQRQHLPPAVVGSGRGIAANALPPSPRSVAGITKMNGNPRKLPPSIQRPRLCQKQSGRNVGQRHLRPDLVRW
jgi:hypothetical protein